MRQNESHAPNDNTGRKTPENGPLEGCPPVAAAPVRGAALAGTPTAQLPQPPGDSEENDPRGAAAMDTSPDAPV